MGARHHIEELQSLRGLAALVVAVSHISSIYPVPPGIRLPIDAVCNAHASIVVFFVLSGYVLTASLMRRGLSWPSIQSFYLARLLRLFPALWVASLLSVVFQLAYPRFVIHPIPSFWFFPYLQPFPSPARLALAALALDWSLIMPVWTVFIEMVGSAMMPALVTAALANRRLFVWALAGMGLAVFPLVYAPHRLDSLVYIFDFALGVLLASRRWPFFENSHPAKLLVPVGTLIFFRFAWLALRNGHPVPLYIGYLYPLPLLVEGVAASFVIGSLASEKGRIRFLRSRWAVGLGNLSYSLYLIHFPVATLLAKLLSRVFTDQTSPTTAAAILLALALPASLGLAFLIYRWVEVPCIALGKNMDQRFIRSRVPAEV